MSDIFYSTLTKTIVFENPTKYGWNLFLKYHQLSEDEILNFRQHLDVIDIVRYQNVATIPFLKKHFTYEIDECWNLTWEEVEIYCHTRTTTDGNTRC